MWELGMGGVTIVNFVQNEQPFAHTSPEPVSIQRSVRLVSTDPKSHIGDPAIVDPPFGFALDVLWLRVLRCQFLHKRTFECRDAATISFKAPSTCSFSRR